MRARVRANPWLAVAITGGVILMLAWIGWAIYVTSDRGATEGLGVLLAWPALIAAVALVALPFVAVYLYTRRSVDDEVEAPPRTDEDHAEVSEPG